VSTDVSDEHTASIFRVEKISSARNHRASRCQRTTRRYIPEDDILQNHRCENLKCYKSNIDYIRVYMEQRESASDAVSLCKNNNYYRYLQYISPSVQAFIIILSWLFNDAVSIETTVSMTWCLTNVRRLVEWELTGKPQIMAQNTLCSPHISHDLISNPDRRSGNSATNGLSYGTAYDLLFTLYLPTLCKCISCTLSWSLWFDEQVLNKLVFIIMQNVL
jgi:hypothetical protein